MPTMEDEYRRLVAQLSPVEKFERMIALNQWARWNIARIIQAELGPLPEEELKWRVALHLYGRDADCRRMIEEQLDRVCNR
ncbi:MAG: hypothetical protein ACK5Q5_16490 [Planctomycetaceae bacterium]